MRVKRLGVALGAAFFFECVKRISAPLGGGFFSHCEKRLSAPPGGGFFFGRVKHLSVSLGGGRGHPTRNPNPQLKFARPGHPSVRRAGEARRELRPPVGNVQKQP